MTMPDRAQRIEDAKTKHDKAFSAVRRAQRRQEKVNADLAAALKEYEAATAELNKVLNGAE